MKSYKQNTAPTFCKTCQTAAGVGVAVVSQHRKKIVLLADLRQFFGLTTPGYKHGTCFSLFQKSYQVREIAPHFVSDLPRNFSRAVRFSVSVFPAFVGFFNYEKKRSPAKKKNQWPTFFHQYVCGELA